MTPHATAVMFEGGIFDAIISRFPLNVRTTETTWPGAMFVSSLAALFKPSTVIEVGCCNGVTSSYLCRVLRDQGQGRYVGYELNPDFAEEASARAKKLYEQHEIHKFEYDGMKTVREIAEAELERTAV